ncbi:MAG: hypothetical protein AAGF72_01850 [Pseudomonadota bacterium]
MDDKHDHALDELLKDYPMPQAEAAFYDRALLNASREGTQRQRNRWVFAGFGSAIAAGFAALLLFGLFSSSPDLPAPDATIPGVTIALEQPRTINLMFGSAEPLDNAMLTVSLPEGIELDGFPGQQEVTWETSLAAGRNVLPLTLVAVKPVSGDVFARLSHLNREQTFQIHIDVGPRRPTQATES